MLINDNNNNQEQNVFLILNLIADILQIADYGINLKGLHSDSVIKELERQNQEYLEVIKNDIKELKEEINGKTLS